MKNAGRIFGRGMKFPPSIGPEGRLLWSEGEENIREAIRVILMTEPRERLHLPDFGGGLRSFLFEPNTPATRQRIQDRIQRALSAWEPRIRIESVSVDADPADPHTAVATITYKLVATQAQEQLSLNVALTGE